MSPIVVLPGQENSAALQALKALQMFDTLVQVCKTTESAKRPSSIVEGAISLGQSLLTRPKATPVSFPSSRSLDSLGPILHGMTVDELRVIMGVVQPLITLYYNRYEHTNNLEDLDISISIAKICLLAETDEIRIHADECHLCELYIFKSRRTRDSEVIIRAITHGRSSFQGIGQENPIHFVSLAMALAERFTLDVTEDNASDIIAIAHKAIVAAEEGRLPAERLLELRMRLSNMAGQILLSNTSTKLETSLTNECIAIQREIIAATPLDHSKYSLRLLILAGLLIKKLGHVEDSACIDEARSILDRLSEDTNKIPPQLLPIVNTYYALFHFRPYTDSILHLKPVGDLDAGLEMAEGTLKEYAESGVDLTSLKGITAIQYLERYERTGDPRDLELSINHSVQLHGVTSMVDWKHMRFGFCLHHARVYHGQHRYEAALQHYRIALDLLPQLVMLGRNYRESEVKCRNDLGGCAAAASVACGHYREALELLEVGRSIGWMRSLRMRSKLDQLETEYPDHAARFKHASEFLERTELAQSRAGTQLDVSSHDGVTEKPWEQRFEWSQRWDVILAEIRTLQGYEDFLDTPSYDQLKHVSEQGPVVVISICEYRSDAFILAPSALDRPQLVCLPDSNNLKESIKSWIVTMFRGLEDKEHGRLDEADFNRIILRPILKTLWKNIVQPIRESLNSLAPYARRIWWCPTGYLTFLPLHLVTNEINGDRTSSQLVPSYTTTLSSLIRARSSLEERCPVSLLSVSCKVADGFDVIPGAEKEVQALRKISSRCKISVEALEGGVATVERVLSAMPKHTWLHLACHGVQSFDKPYLSYFALSDGPLHMSDIVASRLDEAQFAFLSACETATGIPTLCNEAMHLAAGLQFAGFCGSIATMWSVHDKTAMRLTKEVYAFLFRNPNVSPNVEDAAEALWRATQTLKSKHVPISRLAPFIHMGA